MVIPLHCSVLLRLLACCGYRLQAVGKSLPWCRAAPLPPHLLTLVLHLLHLTLFVPPLSPCGISKPSSQMLSPRHCHCGSRAQLCPEVGALELSGMSHVQPRAAPHRGHPAAPTSPWAPAMLCI